MMVNLLWKLNRPSVTAKLEIQFLHPAKVDEPIDFEAHSSSQEGRVTRVQAKAATPAGKVIARASAIYVQLGNRG
jgi:acyl-coenzyme A thioesterase PaaI-like protein